MWGWGELRLLRASPLPLPRQFPSLLPEGRGLRRQSWLGLDAISAASRAPWLEAIFSLGPQACLPACWFSALTPLLRNHTPQASPQTTHTHREQHVCMSWRGDGGIPEVGPGAGEVLVQKPPPGKPHARSGLLTQVLATHFGFLHLPCVPQGDRIPDPRVEKGGRVTQNPVDYDTPRRKPQALCCLQPFPFWLSRVPGEQMGSQEAIPLPHPKGSSEWRVVSSKGGRTEAL